MKSRFLTSAALLVFAAFGHAQVVALTGARVIDGTGKPPIEQATILISNGRITDVGTALKVPAGSTRVDMSGKTIMPGIINAHGHLGVKSDKPARERLSGQLRVYADYGVTTVFVLGTGDDDLEETVKLRDEQERTTPDRARVYCAGPSLRYVKTEEDARKRVDAYADARADFIKFHIFGVPNDTQPPVYRALIDEAHKRGLRAAAHMWYLKDVKGLLDAQIDVLAHSIRDQDVDAETIAKIKARDVGYIATLTRDLAVFDYDKTPDFFTDPFFLRHKDAYAEQMAEISDPAHQEKIRISKDAAMTKIALEQGKKNLKTLSDAGVSIGMGTDSGNNLGQWQGYFEQVEMEMMVKAGLTPMQVLVAATGGGAHVWRLKDLGTIAAGKKADLLVLNANPLDDIRNTRKIDSVWIGGQKLARLPS